MSEKRFVIHDSSVEEYVESLANKNTQGKTKRDLKLVKKGRARVVSNYSMLPYILDTPISEHLDFTILYFVVKGKQIRTIRSKDLSTSLLSFVHFAAELRFV